MASCSSSKSLEALRCLRRCYIYILDRKSSSCTNFKLDANAFSLVCKQFLDLPETLWIMPDEQYEVISFIYVLFYYILEPNPSSFSCLGECYNAVLLWNSRNQQRSGDNDLNFNFGVHSPFKDIPLICVFCCDRTESGATWMCVWMFHIDSKTYIWEFYLDIWKWMWWISYLSPGS